MITQRNQENNQADFMPNLEFDGRNTSKQLSKMIKLRVLQGIFPPEGRREEEMLRDFRQSKLSIKKFMALTP